MESPDLDGDMLEIPMFSSIESEKFKKETVIPYFKDIFKVNFVFSLFLF
jgi:hypothetical protein